MDATLYTCLKCNFTTPLKPNFTRHCTTRKHIEMPELIPESEEEKFHKTLVDLIEKQGQRITELEDKITSMYIDLYKPKKLNKKIKE